MDDMTIINVLRDGAKRIRENGVSIFDVRVDEAAADRIEVLLAERDAAREKVWDTDAKIKAAWAKVDELVAECATWRKRAEKAESDIAEIARCMRGEGEEGSNG